MNILRDITSWVESRDGKCIFWLNGMAGTGKSTIAQTVARKLNRKGGLGASFFFKRGEADRANARYLISTIITQLVKHYPELGPGVLKAVKEEPDISFKPLEQQFNALLLGPLLTLNPAKPTTIVLVIDALDECDQENDINILIRLLSAVQQLQSIHLRIFLTSRPELPIRLGFRENKSHHNLILHELPKPIIEHDIRIFLEDSLSKIQHNRSLPPDWPGIEKTEKLVQMAVPLFIFAATACRFIQEGKHPTQRLNRFIENQDTGKDQMDKIYLPILENFLGNNKEDSDDLRDFHNIVGAIILLSTPLSIQSLALLLELETQYVSEVLESLHSVLYVPSDHKAPVRILHLSFRDHLLATKSQFRIDAQATHGKIALHCLRIMKIQLKENICILPSYGTQQENIEPQRVDKYITADLKYACRYWVHHVEQSKDHVINCDVLPFLQVHFLHWMEVLALMGGVSEAVGLINTLKSRVCVSL